MAFKVVEGEDDVGIHDGTPDFGVVDVLAAGNRHVDFIGAFEAIGDEGVNARNEGVEAIGIGGIKVVESLFAPADIEGVTIGEEGFAAEALDEVAEGSGVVGAKEGEVAGFAKVGFDGHEAPLEVDGVDACLKEELFEFGLKAITHGGGVEVGEVDLCRGHGCAP